MAYSLSVIQNLLIILLKVSFFGLFLHIISSKVRQPYSSFGESKYLPSTWVISHICFYSLAFSLGLSLRTGAGIHNCVWFIVSHSTCIIFLYPCKWFVNCTNILGGRTWTSYLLLRCFLVLFLTCLSPASVLVERAHSFTRAGQALCHCTMLTQPLSILFYFS